MPFCIRAGKYLPVTATKVLVELHRPPQMVFSEVEPGQANYLRFRLGPEVAIAIGARAKVPGEEMVGEEVELYVRHQRGDEMDAYERLIGDAMKGETLPSSHGRTASRRPGVSLTQFCKPRH